MGDTDDLVKEALESSRAKELLLRREGQAIAVAAAALVEALGTGRTLYVLGEAELSVLARYVAHSFFDAQGGAPFRALALGAEGRGGAPAPGEQAYLREVRAFVERGDVLLVLCRDGARGSLAQALDLARSKGAATIAFSGYPGEGIVERADAPIVIPSRRHHVVAESILTLGHLLERLVARRLGRETPPPAGRDPAEPQGGFADASGSSSSGEAIVAELAPERRRHLTSSVELVPLVVDARGGTAPPPPNTIRFRCGDCSQTITVEAKFAGRRGQCPHCLREFTIPASAGESREPVAAASSGARPRDPSASGGASPSGASPSGSAARRPAPAAKPASGSAPPERRRANRVNVKDSRVAFQKESFPDGERQPIEFHALEDLSLTGISFQTSSQPGAPLPDVKVGDQVYILLDFPAFVDRIRVLGECRRVALTPDRTNLVIGIRFSRFLDDAQAKVRRLVENAALRGVRRR